MRVTLCKTASYGAGILLLLASIQTTAFATTVVPEIDGTTAVSALGLLTSGVLLLRARRTRK